MLLLLAGFLALSCSTIVRADLDGTIIPIIVDTTYSFTDGETAKGFVSFKAGFDLPVNGTVNFDLASGLEIVGPINFNNGTIQCNSSVKFEPGIELIGPGFFRSNGKEVVFQGRTFINNKFTFLGRITFRGAGFPEINIGSGSANNARLDLSSSLLTDFTFYNVDLICLKDNVFITASSNLNSFVFRRCNLRSGNNIVNTLKNNAIEFQQEGLFLSSGKNGKWIFEGDLTINGFWRLASQSFMQAKGIRTDSTQSQFILDNAILDIVNSTSDPVRLGTTSVFQGRFSIDGRSILRSSSNNEIVVPNQLKFEFLSGAQLAIENTKVVVE